MLAIKSNFDLMLAIKSNFDLMLAIKSNFNSDIFACDKNLLTLGIVIKY